MGIPWVYGSVYRFEGQVSVFNFDGGPTYADLFPEAPPDELIPSCSEAGVLGVLPGIVGSLQVNEAIKVIVGIGMPLVGKLIYDALEFNKKFSSLVKLRINKLKNQVLYSRNRCSKKSTHYQQLQK